MDDTQIIEAAVRAYDIALKALNDRKLQIEDLRLQIENEIATVTKDRERMQRRKYKSQAKIGVKSNRVRGQSAKLIYDYLSNTDGNGVTQTEISRETGVPISTAGRVLKSDKRFDKTSDDLWRIRDEECDDDFYENEEIDLSIGEKSEPEEN